MTHHLDVELDAPLDSLFSFLADPRNRPRWQSSIVSLSMLSDGPPRTGMKWTEHARGFGVFEMEISAYRENSLWAERGRSERGEIKLTLDFRAGSQPGTTHLTLTLELRLVGLFRWTQGIAPHVLAPLMKSDLKRAAKLAVAKSPPSREPLS